MKIVSNFHQLDQKIFYAYCERIGNAKVNIKNKLVTSKPHMIKTIVGEEQEGYQNRCLSNLITTSYQKGMMFAPA